MQYTKYDLGSKITKMHFLLISDNEFFFHEIKCNGMASFLDFLTFCRVFLNADLLHDSHNLSLVRVVMFVSQDDTKQWCDVRSPFVFITLAIGLNNECNRA